LGKYKDGGNLLKKNRENWDWGRGPLGRYSKKGGSNLEGRVLLFFGKKGGPPNLSREGKIPN